MEKAEEQIKRQIRSYPQAELCAALNITRQTLSKFLNKPVPILNDEDRVLRLYQFFDLKNDMLALEILEKVAQENGFKQELNIQARTEFLISNLKESDLLDSLWIVSANPIDIEYQSAANDMIRNYFTQDCQIVYVVSPYIADKLFDTFLMGMRELSFRKKAFKATLYIISNELIEYTPHFAIRNPLSSQAESWVLIERRRKAIMAQQSFETTQRLIRSYRLPIEKVISGHRFKNKNAIDSMFKLMYDHTDLQAKIR